MGAALGPRPSRFAALAPTHQLPLPQQLLGFDESLARTRTAVERTAPIVGAMFTTLAPWFAKGV